MDILRRHSIRAMHTRNAVKIKKYTENTILRDLLSATLPSSLNSFLPRDAMQARPMPSRGVHLSVCLSVTFVNSVYHTDGDASVNLCLSQPAACMTTTKRREHNRMY